MIFPREASPKPAGPNQNGQIVDSLGRLVAGQAGSITVPNNVGMSQLRVSSDGTIRANGTAIGRFRLVDFQDDQDKLVPAGESCYQMPDATIMILVSRLYEANMKSLSASKEASSSLTSAAMG
ncbi:MAG: hypothetical protein ACYS74_09710 [Planctomycetota bacterium]